MEIKNIISEIGGDALQEALGVSEYSLRAAKRDGKFPASWWTVVKALADRRGVEVSEDLFNFKPSPSQDTAA